MKIRTTLAATGIALGLTVAGAVAANAAQSPDGWSPAQWTHQMSSTVTDQSDPTAPGPGYGRWGMGTHEQLGTGDPTTCPYADDATVDRAQDRVRLQDGTGAQGRMRDRIHATS